MSWGKSLKGAALAVAAIIATAGAKAGVVVKSTGPSAASYPVGRKLDDSSAVSLQAGDSITVLTANGTKVITGPGEFTVGVRGESKRSTFAVLTRQASGARVRTGAVRSGVSAAAPSNPSLWNMDVSKPGRFCIADRTRVNFWRPTTSGERTYVFGSGQSDFLIYLKFADGAAQSALTAEQLPLDANRIYRLSSDAGAPPQLVEFVFLETVPNTPDGLGALLAEKGCNAQLAMLSERLMVSGE